MLNTGHHKRRVAERMQDPEFRAEYERTRQELAQVNEIMRELDALRIEAGLSKAQLAREIGRNDAVVRRLFTADVNPELRTIAALAAALDARIQIVPHRKPRMPRAGRAAAPVRLGRRAVRDGPAVEPHVDQRVGGAPWP